MKDSGQKRQFSTGSQRDFAGNKEAMELLPYDLMMRVANWYKLGADKYGVNNWRLGQPSTAVFGSLMRHLTKYVMGYKDEDHLAAVVWNALCLMNNDTYHADNEEVCDLDKLYVDGKPNFKR